jgi:hypothetical protein
MQDLGKLGGDTGEWNLLSLYQEQSGRSNDIIAMDFGWREISS